MTQKRFACLLFCVVLAVPGCAGHGDISGVVKHRGQPLPAGTISFYDETRGVWSGAIKSDGSYTVPAVPTGIARIAVVTPLAIQLPGAPPPPKTPSIPAKYGDPDKSGLTCVVRDGPQTHNLDLE
jgi:hypothetical protein